MSHTKHRTLTVLPFLIGLVVGFVSLAPTNVVLVNSRGMGIEHEQPWTSTSLDGLATRVRSVGARFTESMRQLWCHPLLGPALTVALVACVDTDAATMVATVPVARFTADRAPSHIANALLRSNLSIPEMRALSPLQEDAQRLVDQAVVRVGIDRLTIVADLMAAGLTTPLTDPLSVMEYQWEVVSEAGGAQRTMLPSARGENQLPGREARKIPIYLTTDDFSVNIRMLQASQRIGQPIDTSLVEQATRRVNEGIEDAMINGAGVVVAGNGTPGLLNAPNVNPFTYVGSEAWTAAGKTGEEILADVMGMVDLQQAAKRYGPYNLYVNTAYGNKLNADFKANGDKTILQRLQELQAGGRNLVVKTADKLPANRTVMLQMTSDVVDIIDGQAPTVIPWTSNDGFVLFWMVMAIQVPRVKDDFDGNSGIVVGNV